MSLVQRKILKNNLARAIRKVGSYLISFSITKFHKKRDHRNIGLDYLLLLIKYYIL